MTDLEKVLKNSLNNFKKTKEVKKSFCENAIVLNASTYERTSKAYSESRANMIDKIYSVIVTIDDVVRFEHYGKDAKEMNNQYLLALEMCQD